MYKEICNICSTSSRTAHNLCYITYSEGKQLQTVDIYASISGRLS